MRLLTESKWQRLCGCHPNSSTPRHNHVVLLHFALCHRNTKYPEIFPSQQGCVYLVLQANIISTVKKKTRNDGERGDLTVKIEPEFCLDGSASILEINELE
jgi:hypothetical protein